MLTVDQALVILTRYTPDLSAEQRTALLNENTVTRTVGGTATPLIDPYAAALDDLFDPERVKARTEGTVSETYIDPKDVADHLRGKSAELRASWPVDDVDVARPLNTRMTLRGWG